MEIYKFRLLYSRPVSKALESRGDTSRLARGKFEHNDAEQAVEHLKKWVLPTQDAQARSAGYTTREKTILERVVTEVIMNTPSTRIE